MVSLNGSTVIQRDILFYDSNHQTLSTKFMTGELRFDRVCKSYPTVARRRSIWGDFFNRENIPERRILENFDLTVKPGEKILFQGANGAGKTTLLKLAGGLIPPDRGEIFFGMKPVDRAPREHFGLMLSSHLLYNSISGYQNLEHSAYLYRCSNVKQTVRDAIDHWDIGHYVDDIVEGYSNGKKVMLALARATLHGPTVLLLDEPDAFLDEKNRSRLREYLRSFSGTCLITAQDNDFLGDVPHRVVQL